jgi:hypothetical protein
VGKYPIIYVNQVVRKAKSIMNLHAFPDWVRKKPEKYIDRLKYEAAQLALLFPHIGIFREGDTMILEGPIITTSKNQYTVRVVYPEEYPYKKPEGYIRDRDVAEYCVQPQNRGHNYHNFGFSHPHGLHLCLLGGSDNVYKGWTLNQTGISILEYSILWIHAYEYKRKTGRWPLRE